ncbi:DUF192 domain-containing protein [Dyella sp.]|uniref:DUF192 domain-containing protein n=1 Tax=Dyella sp. TaxID=1869338 RepID=UPI002ED27132
MKLGALYRNGHCVVPRTWLADTAWSRLCGLLGRPPLRPDAEEALLLSPCGAVHTIGMRYALDIVFLDRIGRVLDCHAALSPGRMRHCRGARLTLELSAGSLARLRPQRGEEFRWKAT